MQEQIEQPDGCVTGLTPSIPADTDAFSTGAHTRTARTIADVIRGAPGGRSIGLEGAWGAGKSTVVNLLEQQFKDDPWTHFVRFDAWAHEGDPLRRSFLERIIADLTSPTVGWGDQKEWKKRASTLSGRQSTTTTTPSVRLTSWGKFAMFLAVLVPVGATLIGAALAGIGSDNFDWSTTLWLMVVGSLFIGAPVVGLISRDDPAFLSIDSIVEQNSTTTETMNPTSLEFEHHFRDLLKDTVGKDSGRKLVLVVDNLDRLHPEESLEVWSTLQTFLQNTTDAEWAPRVWVLLPYDRYAIHRLWNARDPKKGHEIAESFLDKSVQLRFEVPPPALGEWRAYLKGLLEVVLPTHAADWDAITRVYSMVGLDSSGSPTPRDLEIFVNSVGTLHRRWDHTHRLEILALYALLRRQRELSGETFGQQLRSGEIETGRFAMIAGVTEQVLVETLASLWFGSDIATARQLLLGDPIHAALTTNRTPDLEPLVETPGFWDALDAFDMSPLAVEEALNTGAALYRFLRQHPDEQPAMQHALRTRFAAAFRRSSPPLQQPVLLGDAIRAAQDLATTRFVTEAISVHDFTEGDAAGIATLCSEVLHAATEEHEPDQLATLKIALRVPAALAVETARELDSMLTDDALLPLVHFPDVAGAELTEILNAAITEGRLNDVQHVLGRMSACFPKIAWKQVLGVLGKRMRDVESVTDAESTTLFECLDTVSAADAGDTQALFGPLVEEGYALHYLSQLQSEPGTWARWAILHLLAHPDNDVAARPGSAEAGHGILTAVEATPDAHHDKVEALAGLLSDHNDFPFIYQLWEKGVLRQLAAVLLRHVLEAGLRPSAVDLVSHWPIFSGLPKEVLRPLLVELAEEITAVVTEGDVEPSHIALYQQLPVNAGLDQWLAVALARRSAGDWLGDLQARGPYTRLALLLASREGGWELDASVAGPIADHITEVSDGAATKLGQEDLAKLIGRLSAQGQDEVARAAVRKLAGGAPSFFAMVGPAVVDALASRLAGTTDVLDTIGRFVRQGQIDGLEWALSLFALSRPEKGTQGVEELESTIRSEMRRGSETIAEAVGKLAAALGVEVEQEQMEDPQGPDV